MRPMQTLIVGAAVAIAIWVGELVAGPTEARHFIADFGWTGFGLSAAFASGRALLAPIGRDRGGWAWIFMGAVAWAVGQLFWDLYDIVGIRTARHRFEQESGAQAGREMVGGTPHEAHLASCEARAPAAVEAHEAPAITAFYQRNAEFVAKPQRLKDFGITRTALAPANGLDIQGADDPVSSSQVSELVYVVGQKLDAEELSRVGAQDVVDHGIGVQQRRGVGGRKKRGIDRHHPFDLLQCSPPEGARVEAASGKPLEFPHRPLSDCGHCHPPRTS